MKKRILLIALGFLAFSAEIPAWASSSVTAPCDSSCATCQNAMNAFGSQAQQTLAVAAPPNAEKEVTLSSKSSNGTEKSCLTDALNFSLSSVSSTSLSGLMNQAIQTAEKDTINAACNVANSALSKAVSDGNSLMSFNLPSGEFSKLTGMSSFSPVQISNNTSSSGTPSVSMSNSNSSGNLFSNITSNASNQVTSQASNQVENWYNNVLP